MKAKEIILKSMKRANKKRRGLIVSEPNNYLSEGHMKFVWRTDKQRDDRKF